MTELQRARLLGSVRHALSTLGAIFATYGYIDEAEVGVVVGAVMTVVGFVWSFVDKKA